MPLQPSDGEADNAVGAIEKIKDEHCIISKKGKNLGCYKTEEEALTRLRQIEFFKRNGFVKGDLIVKEAPDMVHYESTTAVSREDQLGAIKKNLKGSLDKTLWNTNKEVE
jgi:hypothetical protein